MSTDSTAILHIIDAAYQAAATALDEYPLAEADAMDAARAALHAGGPLMMAAELRRIANDGIGWAIGGHLRALADKYERSVQDR